VEPHPGYRPAGSSVHCTTSCKHSLVFLRMGEIIARNMLSWLELLINCYYCILLVVYIIVLVMHGHTNIKFAINVLRYYARSIDQSWKINFAFSSM